MSMHTHENDVSSHSWKRQQQSQSFDFVKYLGLTKPKLVKGHFFFFFFKAPFLLINNRFSAACVFLTFGQTRVLYTQTCVTRYEASVYVRAFLHLHLPACENRIYQ